MGRCIVCAVDSRLARFSIRAVAVALAITALVVQTGWQNAVAAIDRRQPDDADPRDHIAIGTYNSQFPNDLSSVAAYEQATGKQMTIVHWYALWGGWKGEFSRADLDLVERRGSVPMITWEPWAGVPNDPSWSLRAAILSGQHDAYIEGWARGMAAYGKPVLLRFAHEMHDNLDYPWAIDKLGNTASDYIAAWRHVRDIFENQGATNVVWVWSPNTLGESSSAIHLDVYRSLYPGDEYVDWVGLSIYNTGPNVRWLAPPWRSLSAALDSPYEAISALTDKPLVLAEVASAEAGGDKGAWIREGLGPTLVTQFPRVKALVWFDVVKEESWTVTSSGGAYAAFVDAVRQTHFMADRSGLLTEISSIGRRLSAR
jgi:beta-mannanase